MFSARGDLFDDGEADNNLFDGFDSEADDSELKIVQQIKSTCSITLLWCYVIIDQPLATDHSSADRNDSTAADSQAPEGVVPYLTYMM